MVQQDDVVVVLQGQTEGGQQGCLSTAGSARQADAPVIRFARCERRQLCQQIVAPNEASEGLGKHLCHIESLLLLDAAGRFPRKGSGIGVQFGPEIVEDLAFEGGKALDRFAFSVPSGRVRAETGRQRFEDAGLQFLLPVVIRVLSRSPVGVPLQSAR